MKDVKSSSWVTSTSLRISLITPRAHLKAKNKDFLIGLIENGSATGLQVVVAQCTISLGNFGPTDAACIHVRPHSSVGILNVYPKRGVDFMLVINSHSFIYQAGTQNYLRATRITGLASITYSSQQAYFPGSSMEIYKPPSA